MEPVLEVRNLSSHFFTDEGIVHAVDGVSFRIERGETIGIVGESGSGKSVVAMSLVNLLEEPGRVVGGEILFDGKNVLTMNAGQIRGIRGNGVAMIFQDPMTSLNPVIRIAKQLVEGLLVHGRFTKKTAVERAIGLLARMGLNAPASAIKNYPHQFSGGMRQRVMLAMGLGNQPSLLIADEPTTALDVTIQAQILDLLKELNTDFDVAVMLISHDLGVVATLCSRVIVMYGGEMIEEGATEDLLSDPKHPYTWALINAVPHIDRVADKRKRLTVIEGTPPDPLDHPTGCRFEPRCPFRIEKCRQHPTLESVGPGRKSACWVTQAGGGLPTNDNVEKTVSAASAVERHDGVKDRKTSEPLLELRNVVKYFPFKGHGFFHGEDVIRAVDDVSFKVFSGETVGVVGESGCGKSTLARLIVQIHQLTSGEIWFDGREIGHMKAADVRPLRRRIQMVFQDPYASLNPRMKVGTMIGEPLRFHGITTRGRETEDRVQELLALVGLNPRNADQFPHEFSGGQRQRIGVARALAVAPELILADEPISSLDVNIQAQVINLLVDLQERLDLTYVFISHNLSVVRHIADRTVVLYLGKVVEMVSNQVLFDSPLHPYTKSLITAAQISDVRADKERQRIILTGEAPSPVHPPSGCRFRTRCPIAEPMCRENDPELSEHQSNHWAACHFPGRL